MYNTSKVQYMHGIKGKVVGRLSTRIVHFFNVIVLDRYGWLSETRLDTGVSTVIRTPLEASHDHVAVNRHMIRAYINRPRKRPDS